MQSFIVLGIIPGTSVQLTFNFWLSVAILTVCLPLLRSMWRRRTSLRAYVVAFQISRVINQYQVSA